MQELLLKNNHSMMNTQVETFIIEETEPLIYDNEQLAKWHALVEKLDLKGQKKVAKQGLSPIPFLYMNQMMMRVCRTLCPSHTAIEDYDLTPIPMPVLDLVALSQKEKYFQKVEIWYDEESPDPFCVGIAGYWVNERDFEFMEEMEGDSFDKETHRFNSQEEVDAHRKANEGSRQWYHFEGEKHYLIAKWGDVKQSFEELTERAKARHKEGLVAKIQKNIAHAQQQLANVDREAADYFLKAEEMALPF
jgi:hypothetical protein